MRYVFILTLLLLAPCAFAQNADEQSRFSARVSAQIGDLVVQTDNLIVQIGTLQSQLASAQQRIKDLEAKIPKQEPEQKQDGDK